MPGRDRKRFQLANCKYHVSPVCSFQRTADSGKVLSQVAHRGPARAKARGGSAPALFGGHKAVVRPVPIPNTAVKHSLADGSGFIDSARVGCRQFLN